MNADPNAIFCSQQVIQSIGFSLGESLIGKHLAGFHFNQKEKWIGLTFPEIQYQFRVGSPTAFYSSGYKIASVQSLPAAVISNPSVAGVLMAENDRLLQIRFSDGKALIFQFFGRNGNALVLDAGKISWSLRVNQSEAILELQRWKWQVPASPAGIISLSEGGIPTLEVNSTMLDPLDQISQATRKFFKIARDLKAKEDAENAYLKAVEAYQRKKSALENRLNHLAGWPQFTALGHAVLTASSSFNPDSNSLTITNYESGETSILTLPSHSTPAEYAQVQFAKAKDMQKGWNAAQKQLENLEFPQAKASGQPGRSSAEPPKAIDASKAQISGYQVFFGRNARENDELVKSAHKEDYWFHARGVAGSHVLLKPKIKSQPIPAEVLQQAASLAAWFSKARGSGLVPVDCTKAKYVRKPKGAAPGAVKIEKEQTLIVEPINVLKAAD